MPKYVAARIISMIPTLLGVITLVFLIMRLVPGTIVDRILSQGDAPEEVQRSLRAFFGLDRPLYVQYLDYLLGLARLDLGVSWRARFPTVELLAGALPITLQLAFMAATISMVVGVLF